VHDKHDCDVAIVGGGVSGIAAAYTLSKAGLDVVVYEKDADVGGRARTLLVEGKPVDIGAQFLSSFYTETLKLIAEVGLASALRSRSQWAYIARDQIEYPIWPLSPLLRGHALTWTNKLNLGSLAVPLMRHWGSLDIARLWRSATLDTQSAQQFLVSKVGEQNVRLFVAPLLRGLLFWDTDTTSAPVVLSMLKAFATGRGTFRLDGGVGSLSTALAKTLTVHRESEVKKVSPLNTGVRLEAIIGGSEQTISARSVICATTASTASRLFQWIRDSRVDFLDSITYSQTVMLFFEAPIDAEDYPSGAIVFPVPDVPDLSSINPSYAALEDMGKRNELRPITISLSSIGAQKHAHLPDAELEEKVLALVTKAIGSKSWTNRARLLHIQRWSEAIPRFNVGHLRRLSAVQRQFGAVNGVAFAGDYIGGPYIDGAVRSGLRAAKDVLMHMGH